MRNPNVPMPTNGGRKKSPEMLLAEDMGFKGLHPDRIIRRMGGTKRLAKMSYEARNLMLNLARSKRDERAAEND